MTDRNTIPFAALFDESGIGPNRSSDPRAALHAAEVIVGVDVMTRQEFVVFGRKRLREVADSEGKEEAIAMFVELD